MINLRNVESMIGILTIGIAYIIGATTAGYAQAWIAKYMGDDTPEQAGFLTWNPLVHIDPMGAALLLYIGIGWSKYIPINHDLIQGRWRLAAVYFANVITYLILAISALFLLSTLFGTTTLNLALSMVLTNSVSLSVLTAFYPHASSFTLAFSFVLITLFYLGIVFAVLNFIIDGFRFVMTAFVHDHEDVKEGDFLTFIVPILIVLVFSSSLRAYLIYAISYISSLVLPFLGVS